MHNVFVSAHHRRCRYRYRHQRQKLLVKRSYIDDTKRKKIMHRTFEVYGVLRLILATINNCVCVILLLLLLLLFSCFIVLN